MAGNISSAVKPLPSLPPTPTHHHRPPFRAVRQSSVPGARPLCEALFERWRGHINLSLTPSTYIAGALYDVHRCPHRYGVNPPLYCHESTSSKLNRPTDRTIDRSVTRYTRPVQYWIIPCSSHARDGLRSLNLDHHWQCLELASLTRALDVDYVYENSIITTRVNARDSRWYIDRRDYRYFRQIIVQQFNSNTVNCYKFFYNTRYFSHTFIVSCNIFFFY